MITRRNWLLRCSILINIAVLLYICSHVMIGSGNLTLGPAFVIQEDYAVKQPVRPHVAAAAMLQGLDGNSGSSSSGAHERQQQQQQQQQAMIRDDPDLPLEPESNQVTNITSTQIKMHYIVLDMLTISNNKKSKEIFLFS